MQLTDEIFRKLKEASKDRIIFDLINELKEFLFENNIRFLTIGSCAVLSHSNFISRIPNDIDIAISHEDFIKVEKVFQERYNLTKRTGFYEFRLNKFKGHLVVNTLNIIDYLDKQVFTNINLDLPHNLRTKKNIKTSIANKSVNLTVPVKEACLILNLIGPLNSNIFGDSLSLLKDDIDLSNIAGFIDLQNESQIVSLIFEERLAQLLAILQRRNIPHKEAIRANIFRIMESIV